MTELLVTAMVKCPKQNAFTALVKCADCDHRAMPSTRMQTFTTSANTANLSDAKRSSSKALESDKKEAYECMMYSTYTTDTVIRLLE